MAKIVDLNSFTQLTSSITVFSHAYLFSTNSLSEAYKYIKEFAKIIICGQNYKDDEYQNICYQIDNMEYDDLYVVNPDTITINNIDIMNLMKYMETKSLRENGKRVYIIYGFERLSPLLSNKILKFLEEPNDNIYALLITENIEKILPTIISRCQVINLTFEVEDINRRQLELMNSFLDSIITRGNKTIAYISSYFQDSVLDRNQVYEDFSLLEKIISYNLSNKYSSPNNGDLFNKNLIELPSNVLINLLDITEKLKNLIKQNINLNLLLDRYIIETTRELMLCKE